MQVHVALNELYDVIVEKVDTLAEQWQGKTGALLGVANLPAIIVPQSALECVKDIEDSIERIRDRDQIINQDSVTSNIIDELISSVRSTVYKLTFLK